MIPASPTPPAPDWRAQAKGLVDRILATGGVGFYRSAIDAVADALAAAYTEGQRDGEALTIDQVIAHCWTQGIGHVEGTNADEVVSSIKALLVATPPRREGEDDDRINLRSH